MFKSIIVSLFLAVGIFGFIYFSTTPKKSSFDTDMRTNIKVNTNRLNTQTTKTISGLVTQTKQSGSTNVSSAIQIKVTTTPPPKTKVMSPSTNLLLTQNGFLISGTFCIIDYTLAPQSEVNARRLISFCEIDIPKLEAKFGQGPSTPPYKIKFYTPAPGSQGTGGDARAYAAASDGVFLSTDYWQTEFPYDAEILAHELTHVIQSFSGYNTPEYPGWLVESLADYGAYVAGYSTDLEKNCYGFLTDMQNQTHIYGCTYKFLKFIGGKYDSEIPFKLHRALQSGTYSDNLWIQYTGKTFNQLTSECSKDSNCGGLYHGGL